MCLWRSYCVPDGPVEILIFSGGFEKSVSGRQRNGRVRLDYIGVAQGHLPFVRSNRLLDDLFRGRPLPSQIAVSGQDSKSKSANDELANWFSKWVQIFQRSATPEKSFVAFIQQLQKESILSGEESHSFFRVCTETSVESYRKHVAAGDLGNAFQPIDALSRLIALLIKYHGDASAANQDQAKVRYLSKILSIVVLVLAHMHEQQGSEFQQKPFFRFFSSLLNDLHAMESSLHGASFQILISLWSVFRRLSCRTFLTRLQRQFQYPAADILPRFCVFMDRPDFPQAVPPQTAHVGEQRSLLFYRFP